MKKFNLIRHVTVSLIFGMLLALAICTISIAAVPNVKIPKVEYRGGIYYLVLDAKTPFERGYQHGKALEFPIKFALRNFIEWKLKLKMDLSACRKTLWYIIDKGLSISMLNPQLIETLPT